MRTLAWLMLMSCVAGCGTVVSNTPVSPTPSVAAPFVEPMDPGTLSCQAIASNPAALAFATDWAAGQMRARLMQGAAIAVDEAQIAASLSAFCAQGGNASLPLKTALGSLV